MATIKFDTWVDKYLGTSIDYDGVSGVQCVDLIKHYVKNVLGITPQSIGNAIEYYNKRNSSSYLSNNFTWKNNTSSFIPQKGDIGVFNNSTAGHVCVCSGEGTTSYFYSYDQNWNVKPMTKVKHTYTNFLGVLRPKNQDNMTSEYTMYVCTTTSNLNVRSSAKSTASIKSKLASGTKVTATKTSGSWTYITSPTTGWVSTQYLSSTAPKTTSTTYKVKTSGSNLNCRKTASTLGSKVGQFKNGTVVTYNGKSGSWYNVTGTATTGKTITGYCKSSYLVKS